MRVIHVGKKYKLGKLLAKFQTRTNQFSLPISREIVYIVWGFSRIISLTQISGKTYLIWPVLVQILDLNFIHFECSRPRNKNNEAYDGTQYFV
jgi:hypothetical protein